MWIAAFALGVLGIQSVALPVHETFHWAQSVFQPAQAVQQIVEGGCDLCQSLHSNPSHFLSVPSAEYLPTSLPKASPRAEAQVSNVRLRVAGARAPPAS